jgi:hypothetical protein
MSTVRRALALTDFQMRELQRAAARLPLASRDWFLQAVARHLTGEVSDEALMTAINNAYDRAVAIDGIREAV